MSAILDRFFRVTTLLHAEYAYNKYVKRTRRMISDHFKKSKTKKRLTREQASEVRSFYKQLTGKKVSLLYHEYFYSRTGHYSKEYMPIDLYETDIIGRANRLDYYDASFSDKNMDEVYLSHIRHPYSYLKNINGYFYFAGNPVSGSEALDLCKNLKEVIIKPSQSSKGKGVQLINVDNGVTDVNGLSFEKLLDSYGTNYIIQERIKQHEALSALNPTSVNTMRILTYRSGMEILVVYAVIRIGRKGQVIDNQSAGGISTVINEDGTLGKYGFGAAGDDMIEKTDTGIVLDGYKIPYFDRAIDAVKRSHFDLPFFDLVGWDVSISPDGEPILVEWNGKAGPSQTACGTGLGQYTERIIKEVWPRKNTRSFGHGLRH